MHMLYDTRTVHPLDRYDYYRSAAATELAPVEIEGRAPADLLATMSVARVGDLSVEVVTQSANFEITARRTPRLIRAGDPGCYRLCIGVTTGVRAAHGGHRVLLEARDIALFDLSRPWQTVHAAGPGELKVVMVTFPRALLPVPDAELRPLVGDVLPRNLPGRGQVAHLLADLTASGSGLTDPAPDLADALRECAIGLVLQRLGRPDAITPQTRRLLHLARVREIIRRHLNNPALDPQHIARAANICPRYVHRIFEDTGLTLMQLVKQLRLEECRRRLEDPAGAMTPIKEVMAEHGYRRADQFARDFKRHFGVSPKQVRALTDEGREP
jgi:AraC-like DNA-binding protein